MQGKDFQEFYFPDKIVLQEFGCALLAWYQPDARPMPWKAEKDPFKIWLSEIILQQTRVEQGLPYYLKFTERFKNVTELAHAEENEVLQLWEGLGYYSRARNMHKAAKIMTGEYNGTFPDNLKDLLSLPGIGSYTAAAIAAFAFELPHAVVDGNVHRILSRYFCFGLPVDKAAGKKELQLLAQAVLGKHPPHLYNQAIMDLGALVCKPQQPLCNLCPLKSRCYAFAHNAQQDLPLPKKMLQKKKRQIIYFLLHNQKQFLLQKRVEKDIWQGLFELIRLETESRKNHYQVLPEEINPIKGSRWKFEIAAELPAQELTHQKVYMKIYIFSLKEKWPESLPDGLVAADFKARRNFSMPRTLRKFVESHPYLLDLYDSFKDITQTHD
jgi:A/G-specific adenine glycosylase